MKKRIISLLLVFIIVFIPTGILAKDLTILVDGKEIVSDVHPFIKDNRTMVPIRFIVEALGGEANYTTESYPVPAAIIYGPESDLWLTLFDGKPIALISEGTYRSDVSPIIKSGRTMVTLRFTADYLNCDVRWDEANWAVHITSGAYSTDKGANIFYEKYWDQAASDKIGQWLMSENSTTEDFLKALE